MAVKKYLKFSKKILDVELTNYLRDYMYDLGVITDVSVYVVYVDFSDNSMYGNILTKYLVRNKSGSVYEISNNARSFDGVIGRKTYKKIVRGTVNDISTDSKTKVM